MIPQKKLYLSPKVWSFLAAALILSVSLAAAKLVANDFDTSEAVILSLAGLTAVIVTHQVPAAQEKFLFSRHTAYRKALSEASHELLDTLSIKEATTVVLDILRQHFQADKTVIFLRELQNRGFTPRAFDGLSNLNVPMQANHPLIKSMQRIQAVVLREHLAGLIESEKEPRRLSELQRTEEMFRLLDIAAAVPLLVEGKIIGFMLLGARDTGPYDKIDVQFLTELADKAAVVFDNARVHQQSLEFGKKMKSAAQQASQELKMAHQQLVNLDRAKSDFLSIASHQLYTPLTALRGYLSMLIEGDYGTLALEQRPVISILDKSVSRLINETRELLDVTALESGRVELELESVDLVLMINSLIEELRPTADNKGLKITFEHTGQPLRVTADRNRLKQVLYNFIDNGIKYSNKGSVRVGAQREGNYVVFGITDTGKGLSRAEIPMLFTKFSRAQDAAHYYTEGSGLGLYIAQQIARAHGGEISVESSGHNKGSTFTLRLPIEGSAASIKTGARAGNAVAV